MLEKRALKIAEKRIKNMKHSILGLIKTSLLSGGKLSDVKYYARCKKCNNKVEIVVNDDNSVQFVEESALTTFCIV